MKPKHPDARDTPLITTGWRPQRFPLERCMHSVPFQSPREFSWSVSLPWPLFSFSISRTQFTNYIKYYMSSVFHWLTAFCALADDRVEWRFLSLTPVIAVIIPQGVMWEVRMSHTAAHVDTCGLSQGGQPYPSFFHLAEPLPAVVCRWMAEICMQIEAYKFS